MYEVISIVGLTLAVFMFGHVVGCRTARKDYEPLIDRALNLLEKIERWRTP